MQCKKVRQQLSAAPDQTKPVNPDRQAHLESCESCLHFSQELVALNALLAQDEDEEPRPGFDTRFHARLNALKNQPTRSGWLPLRWAVAGVSAALVAATALFLVVPGGSTPSMTAEELDLAMNLELFENFEMVRSLEEVEAFETLAMLDESELDRLLTEVGDRP